MTFFEILLRRWPQFLEQSLEHIQLVLASIAVATVVGVLLALWTYRHERRATLVLAVTVPLVPVFMVLVGLAAKRASEDEWKRAINPVVSGIERRLKTNAYWADNGYGTTQVNLRGLGINRTLVLIDGRPISRLTRRQLARRVGRLAEPAVQVGEDIARDGAERG